MQCKFKTEPYEHQIGALKRSWNKKEYAYFRKWGIESINRQYFYALTKAVLIRSYRSSKGVYRVGQKKKY